MTMCVILGRDIVCSDGTGIARLDTCSGASDHPRIFRTVHSSVIGLYSTAFGLLAS